MADAHFYLFGQRKERLFHQIVEEGYLLEDCLIGLLQNFFLEASGKLFNEILFLFETELFLYVYRLVDIVVDSAAEVFGQIVLYDQFLENFEVFALFDVLRPNVGDQISDTIDVVGEHKAANHLDKDQTDRLLIGRGIDISEPHSQHYIRPPVVGPNVFLCPVSICYISCYQPIFL